MLKELSQVNNNVQDFSHYNALQITSFRSNIHAIGLHLLLVEDGILCSNRTVFHFIDGFCHFTRLALHELRWQWAFRRHIYSVHAHTPSVDGRSYSYWIHDKQIDRGNPSAITDVAQPKVKFALSMSFRNEQEHHELSVSLIRFKYSFPHPFPAPLCPTSPRTDINLLRIHLKRKWSGWKFGTWKRF